MSIRENQQIIQNYFNKEFGDFNASYENPKEIKDFIRKISYRFNQKAIHGRLNAILELLGQDCKEKEILDIGCGPGTYDIQLAKRGAFVTGLDYSKGMIDIAKKNSQKENLNINFILGDIFDDHTKLFNDRKFDNVFSVGVAEYIDPRKHQIFLQTLASLSKNFVIVSFPKKYTIHAIIRKIWLKLFKGFKIKFFSNREIQNFAKNSGLKEVDRKDVGILWVIKFKKDV